MKTSYGIEHFIDGRLDFYRP